MKDFFDVVLILFITLTMFICMMFFAEELAVEQEAIHLRNRVIEIIEIENGYTETAKNKVDNLIEKSERDIVVNVSKNGVLEYGEQILIEVNIFYQRRLPFNQSGEMIKYRVTGEYYNING